MVRAKGHLRVVLLIAIGALFLLSIPWYRRAGDEVTLVWGLPDWVTVALGCYVGVALLNAIAWLSTDVEDPPASSDEGSG